MFKGGFSEVVTFVWGLEPSIRVCQALGSGDAKIKRW